MTSTLTPSVASDTPAPIRRDFPALNGARAIAAYSVIATHVGFNTGRSVDGRPFAGLLFHLDFGVTLFFLLSGFLLSRQFFLAGALSTEPPGLRRFWWRRALRILPAYWVSIIVVLAVLSTRHATFGDWMSYLLLIQTYNHHALDPSLSQMWTLVVEVGFYVVLPVLIWLSRQLRTTRHTQIVVLIGSMFAISLGGNILSHELGGEASNAQLWLPLYLDWFALGMLMASLSVDIASPAGWQRAPIRWAQSTATCWVIGAVLLWFSVLPLTGPRALVALTTWEWTFKHYLYAGSAFFFLLPLVVGSEPWTDRVLGNRVMRWFGEISYGVYLWHLALLIAIQRWMGWPTFGGHFAPLYGLTAAAATGAAALSWYVLERPLLRRFSSSWRRPPRDQAAAQ